MELHQGTSATSISFKKLTGIFIGDTSSTFKIHKSLGGNLGKYSVQPTDCITVLSEFRNFDFATTDDQAKYDIYSVISWKISANACRGSIIPLSRGKIVLVKIRMKLEELARTRYLFLEELFLLGIMKTLIQMGESKDKIEKIKGMLNRKLKLDQKIFRITQRMKPKNFVSPVNFQERFKNSHRASMLQRQMMHKILIKDRKQLQFMREWQTIKYGDLLTIKMKAALGKKHKTANDAMVSRSERFQKCSTKSVNK